jgi:hypothetical protein
MSYHERGLDVLGHLVAFKAPLAQSGFYDSLKKIQWMAPMFLNLKWRPHSLKLFPSWKLRQKKTKFWLKFCDSRWHQENCPWGQLCSQLQRWYLNLKNQIKLQTKGQSHKTISD